MKDIETDRLNGEKCKSNGCSDHLTSRKKNGCKTQKSMDAEFHAHSSDDNIDNDGGHRNVLDDNPSEEQSAKKNESNQIIDSDSDFDSDEDTFADAESDCEPNQFFLDEMLEDYHPERLNLFDYRKKEQNKRRSSRTMSSTDSLNDDNDPSINRHDENDMDASLHTSIHNRLHKMLNLDDDSESSTDDSDDGSNDSFGNLPTIRNKGRGRLSMGTSPGVGPGRAMLRQASQKAVWGK